MSQLFVIEGLDGAGKRTQATELAHKLHALGYEVHLLTFPNYESRACEPVKMYLEGELGNNPMDVNAYAISSFYAIDRYVTYVKEWGKVWNKGAIFIADRYVDSNAIYQMSKLPKNDWENFINWLHNYEHELLMLPRPTKTFFLDIPEKVSSQLLEKRYCGDLDKKDIHENDIDFQKSCRDAALYCASTLGWTTINCCNGNKLKSISEINDELFHCIENDLVNSGSHNYGHCC